MLLLAVIEREPVHADVADARREYYFVTQAARSTREYERATFPENWSLERNSDRATVRSQILER
jgi:hypothetical protein